MRIYVLTTVYPSISSPKGTTPVVHYFTREWINQGVDVHVFHVNSTFPKLYYIAGKLLKNILESRLGHTVPSEYPKEYEEVRDGVKVSHINISKRRPYGRFSKRQIDKIYSFISGIVEKDGVPDIFVAHWDNPCLELLHLLKIKFQKPTCLVFHINRFEKLKDFYKPDFDALIKNIDILGFRNITAKENFESLYGNHFQTFIAASGVSKSFIEIGTKYHKTISQVTKFIYVGFLIERKHPVEVFQALCYSYEKDPFEMTYIGSGKEKIRIEEIYNSKECNGKLTFTGRIPREDVITHMKKADVFIMISEGEIFGLVYLEAMALGCITIASRHEGIDGIIEDGVNGFLCEPGNTNELTSIINKIRRMSSQELNEISRRAQLTAFQYSDVNVANSYINNINKVMK